MNQLACLTACTLVACTTLGPTPATTGVSAIPAHRPGVELQSGLVPGYYLSDSTHGGEPTYEGIRQLAAVVEPDRLLGRRGLVLGARSWGDAGDSPFEPMIGLRKRLDESFAIAGIAHGTYARGAEAGASYEALRLGGELVLDGRLLPLASWLAVHVQAAVSATYLDAIGRYCVTSTGEGTDCDESTPVIDGEVRGVYSAATAGVSVDLGRRPHGVLHGIRIALVGSVGAMPRVRGGIQQREHDVYRSIGLTLTLGLGSDR